LKRSLLLRDIPFPWLLALRYLRSTRRDAFASIPANHAHYAMARGQTIVQVHGLGPFVLTYVNPADDPTKK